MREPQGFTLVEAVVAIALTALVIQGGWSVLATLRRSGEKASASAERLETVRTVAWILEQELAGGRPGGDWWPGDGDTLGLRAYRGLAVVRDSSGGGTLEVCFRGMRAPNPAKDSVLLLSGSGLWTPHALVSRVRGEAGCFGGTDGWVERWTMEPMARGSVFGRVFERGSYHLADMALRYRRGAGGRQPLTPLRIAAGEMTEGGWDGEGLQWSIRLSDAFGAGDTLPWRGRIR